MSIFKEFLDAVQAGDARRDLFLMPHKEELLHQMSYLSELSDARDLDCMVLGARQAVHYPKGYAQFRIAHANLHRETALKGYTWTAIHGLDTLNGFPDAHLMKQELMSRVR